MHIEDITSGQFWGAVALILILIGAYNTVMSAIKTHREEKRLRDSPVVKLSERLDRHDELLAKDKDRLDQHDREIKAIGEESRIMLRGVRALLSHEINGNSDERLRESANEIDEYLISRK